MSNSQQTREKAREVRKQFKDRLHTLVERFVQEGESGPLGLYYWTNFDNADEALAEFLKWTHNLED